MENTFRNALTALNQRQFLDAERLFKDVLKNVPEHVATLNLLTIVLMSMNRFAEAEDFISRAIVLDRESDVSFYNYGTILKQLHKPNEALEQFDSALRLNAKVSETWNNRGTVFSDLQQHERAISDFDQAILLDPDYAEAFCNKGKSLHELKRHQDALAAYDKALTLKPDLAEAWFGRGNVFWQLNLNDKATADFQRAVTAKPNYSEARFAACFAELPILYAYEEEIVRRRNAYAQKLGALKDYVGDPAKAIEVTGTPFYLAYQGVNDRDLQALYGSTVCRIMERKYQAAPLPPPPPPDKPVRVGIVSAFFHQHPVWNLLIKGWISQLDRKRFQIFGYHLGTRSDVETDVAANMCDRFVHRSLTVNEWRQEILSDAPHVLIYPGLFMENISMLLAAQRLAPVQCNSWGHPETSGMPTLDYFLSSDLMEPFDATEHYTEQLIRLPNLSIYYEPIKTDIATVSRDELGLRSEATIFWSGQSLFKYLPQFDHVFPHIAKEIPDCQFVFIDFPGVPQIRKLFLERLDRAFALFDLKASDHCAVLPRLSVAKFVGAIGQCDIFLDSVGWSGGNSTLESLPHNKPIVTMPGDLMRARHTAAILRKLGITETIANNLEEYVGIAVRLAKNVDERHALSVKISANKHRLYRDRECIDALERFLDRSARQKAV